MWGSCSTRTHAQYKLFVYLIQMVLYTQYKRFVCSIQTFVYPIQTVCMLNTNFCIPNTNGLYAQYKLLYTQYKWFVCSIQTFVYPIQMVCMLNTNGLYAQYKLLYIQYKPFCMLNMNFCISNTNRFVCSI